MKSYIKKAVALVLAVGMMLAMTACGDKELSDQVRIGTLVGPTGMGLINLQDEENIDMQIYQSPTDVVQKLIAGELDVACVPSNMGALLNAKTNGGVRILSDVVNGGLFIVENGKAVKSLADLEGKTVIASGKGGTPEYVLAALLANAGLDMNKDVKVQWLEDHAAVSQKVMTTEGSVGLLPEPMKSTIISKNPAIRAAIDLDAAWNEMTGERLPMGIVIARKDFVEERSEDVDYLLEMVMDSVTAVQTKSDEVVNKIVEAGIIPDSDICKSVIDNDLLVCLSGEDTKAILTPFYETLFKMDPAAVGGKVPGDEIYYGIE